MPQTRIGISGWRYVPWRGTFYPKGLAQHRELEYASRKLNSIELNGSFYSLQRPESYRNWYESTPEDFVFSVKGPRFITHIRRLKEVEAPLANFFASGVLRLEEKLGPIFWQFPPNFLFDEGRFDAFFQLLPRTTREAAKLARQHEPRMKGRSWTKTDADRPIRHAVEIRHSSFADKAFISLLRRTDIAVVFADTAGKWPVIEDVTAKDFIYARLHGEEELYVSGYDDAAIDRWADRFALWRRGKEPADAKRIAGPAPKSSARPRDVFVYFDNDVKVRSPFDAMRLAHRLGVGPKPEPFPSDAFRSITATARSQWPAVGRRKSIQTKTVHKAKKRAIIGRKTKAYHN